MAEPDEAAISDLGPGPVVQPAPGCAHCGAGLKAGASFCGSCGARQGDWTPPIHVPGPKPTDSFGNIRLLLALYGSTMLVIGGWAIYGRVSEELFLTDVGATTCLALLVFGFALAHRELFGDSLQHSGWSWPGYLMILLLSVPILLLVEGYVSGIARVFGIHPPGELDAFRGYSILWPLLMMVVLPPLSEELAFRGLIYGGLRKSMSVGETFLVSSFAFAMLHLSIPSLVTHLPLGLYFCWLRHHSGSVWPAVFAHACHNLGVVLIEWQ